MHESVSVDPAKKMAISLVDCLRKYGAKEQLSQNDTWYCSKCKDHRRAFKKLDLWSTPDVLIVHLKRFQYAQGTYFVHTTKLDDLVDKSEALSMQSKAFYKTARKTNSCCGTSWG